MMELIMATKLISIAMKLMKAKKVNLKKEKID